MKPLRGTTLACALALLAVPATHARATAAVLPLPAPSAGAQVQVFFSPDDGTDRAIALAMAQARQRVWVAGYYFTSSILAKALDQAHERGLDVRVVLDRSQVSQRYSSATYFHNHGVPLWINARYPVMHHKFVVIDQDTVGFGSMNFTRAGAQQNAENFNLFRRWPQLVGTYAAEFQRLQKESVTYRPGMVFDTDGNPEEKP